MPEAAVVNASPLIFLARAACFDLLQLAGDRVLVPESVDTELRTFDSSDPAVLAIDQATWLIKVGDPPIPSLISAWDLGAGESAVLAWAQAHPGTEAVIDDFAARRCAATIGVPARGTLGIVLKAKQNGIIPSARTIVEHMRQTGMYLSDEIMNQALALVGE
ncbi:MAG TPA: DUF3368 domain-containing protein [Pirellulales bacterium]|nr:DUF3368 domain-containing protein [Pirellulales bacterium]